MSKWKWFLCPGASGPRRTRKMSGRAASRAASERRKLRGRTPSRSLALQCSRRVTSNAPCSDRGRSRDGSDAASKSKPLAQEVWLTYLEQLDPIRPDLFRYCRRLTGNVWDAEDLAQDSVEQGFSRFVVAGREIANPRGYVLRIASNLWISRQRRARLERESESARDGRSESVQPQAAFSPDSSSALRDVGAALLQLAPQERAAVLLKEIFDRCPTRTWKRRPTTAA